MEKKILIIEDNETHFLRLKQLLEERDDCSYTVIPKDFKKMSKVMNSDCDCDCDGDLDDFVAQQIKDNYKELKLVLCDIQLVDDDEGGCEVVKTIRRLEKSYSSYLDGLPIIGITKYTNLEKNILKSGASLSLHKQLLKKEPEVILVTIKNQIDIFENHLKIMNENQQNSKTQKDNVFIVHGHDSKARKDVELFVHQLGLNPIVLSQHANVGNTIIEKLFREISNVKFSIVLYTGCDKGKSKEEKRLKPRARQNVVFEHGLLFGILGRDKVAALVEEGVEIPGDLNGLGYITIDDGLQWQIELIREMDAIGLPIDVNNYLKIHNSNKSYKIK